jgi:hypothetical protein
MLFIIPIGTKNSKNKSAKSPLALAFFYAPMYNNLDNAASPQ